MDIDFLGLEDVLAIHADQISRYGGDHGLRDPGLLASAIAQPQAGSGELFNLTMSLAKGQVDRSDLAAFFRRHMK